MTELFKPGDRIRRIDRRCGGSTLEVGDIVTFKSYDNENYNMLALEEFPGLFVAKLFEPVVPAQSWDKVKAGAEVKLRVKATNSTFTAPVDKTQTYGLSILGAPISWWRANWYIELIEVTRPLPTKPGSVIKDQGITWLRTIFDWLVIDGSGAGYMTSADALPERLSDRWKLVRDGIGD